MELRQGKHPTLSVAFTVSTLSSLYPFSFFLSRQSSSDQRTGLKVTNALTHACHRYSHWFFPPLSLSLSLSRSVHHPVPSIPRLSLLFSSMYREREREGKFFFSWRKRGKNSSLFFFLLFFFQRGKKGKDSTGNRAEEHLLLVARRIEGEVSWPEPWVQQGAPGEIPSHGYWFTMPRIIRHYLMWYMGSRGQRFSRLERRERERDRLVKAFFPLRLRGESLICMIDGTRLHDRTHPITDRPPIVKLDV